MPKLAAEELDLDRAREFFAQHDDLKHIRVRKRGELLIIESGPDDDPVHHARLRRTTKQYWTLEMATHTGRWERTPFRATRDEILDMLVSQFGWTLTDIAGGAHPNAARTSDPQY
jgi:hypothetical protein